MLFWALGGPHIYIYIYIKGSKVDRCMRVSPLNEIQVLNVSLSLEKVCKIDGANYQIQN